MSTLLIRNGRVITAVDDYLADVFIDDETVAVIGRNLELEADEIIDAAGRYLFPGGVGPHTHLDMPFGGTTSADDFETGTRAAAHGGISSWRDAAEFIAMGCGSVQVCTAAMHHGFKIIDDFCDGLNNWMDSKGYASLDDFRGRAIANTTDWQYLDLNYKTLAYIDQEKCIECGLCHIACEDASHQAISHQKVNGRRVYTVINDECVGCNLCALICPVPNCITMIEVNNGQPYLNWTEHPNNPMRS